MNQKIYPLCSGRIKNKNKVFVKVTLTLSYNMLVKKGKYKTKTFDSMI